MSLNPIQFTSIDLGSLVHGGGQIPPSLTMEPDYLDTWNFICSHSMVNVGHMPNFDPLGPPVRPELAQKGRKRPFLMNLHCCATANSVKMKQCHALCWACTKQYLPSTGHGSTDIFYVIYIITSSNIKLVGWGGLGHAYVCCLILLNKGYFVPDEQSLLCYYLLFSFPCIFFVHPFFSFLLIISFILAK